MGSDRPVPPRPDQRPLPLPPPSWIKLVVAVGLALAAIALFPRSGGDAPPLASLALIGAVIAGVTTVALHAIVRRDLRLPSRVATSLAFAFVLIALVKFVLAPLGLYEVNAVDALEDAFGTVADPGGAAITAAAVFGLLPWGTRSPSGSGVAIAHRSNDRASIVIAHRSEDGASSWASCSGCSPSLGSGSSCSSFSPLPGSTWSSCSRRGRGFWSPSRWRRRQRLIGSAFRTLVRQPQVVADVGAIVTLFWLGLAFLALVYGSVFIALTGRPDDIEIAYKG